MSTDSDIVNALLQLQASRFNVASISHTRGGSTVASTKNVPTALKAASSSSRRKRKASDTPQASSSIPPTKVSRTTEKTKVSATKGSSQETKKKTQTKRSHSTTTSTKKTTPRSGAKGGDGANEVKKVKLDNSKTVTKKKSVKNKKEKTITVADVKAVAEKEKVYVARKKRTKMGVNPSISAILKASSSKIIPKVVKVVNYTSTYVGVFFTKCSASPQAQVKDPNGGIIHLGSFSTEVEAAKAYDKYIVENKVHRRINFPLDYPKHDMKKKKSGAETASCYIGVYKNSSGSFAAQVSMNQKNVNLGSYTSEVAAAKARDAFIVAQKLDRQLNFAEDYPGYKGERNTKKSVNSSSKYRGVHKYGNSFRAIVCGDHRSRYVGSFQTELLAAKAYDAYIIEHKLTDIKPLNFPETIQSLKKGKA